MVSDRASRAAPRSPRPRRVSPERPRVLVVDDEASIRELLTRTLALTEYDVEAVADGRTGLDRLRLGPYDLLIADLRMPVMDGLTLIREARRLQPNLKVIIITGYSTESSAIEAVNLGVVGYLVKPFRVPQVLACRGPRAGRNLGEEPLRTRPVHLQLAEPEPEPNQMRPRLPSKQLPLPSKLVERLIRP